MADRQRLQHRRHPVEPRLRRGHRHRFYQTQNAFGVKLGKYNVKGQTLRAADKNLSVPANLASDVLGVVGVDQATNLFKPDHTDGIDSGKATKSVQPSDVAPGPGFRNAPPCSSYYGEKVDTTDPAYNGKQLTYAPCGYTPAQLRSAYGVDQAAKFGADGHGTTIAIVDAFASPTIYADASTYAKKNDPQHPLKQSQFSQHVFPANPVLEPPDQCDAAGWYGEETLDVEAAHGLAPGANILYVGGESCEDNALDEALNYVIMRPQGRHRVELLRRHRRGHPGRRGQGLQPDLAAGGPRGHRRLLLLGRQR